MKEQPPLSNDGSAPPRAIPTAARHAVVDPSLHILLDLNYTLVADSHLKKQWKGPYLDKILAENYHADLLALIRGHTVLLCTVRKAWHEDLTLRNIARKCDGWQPHRAYFNRTKSWQGNIVKREYLVDRIFPEFGEPPQTRYYAIESLPAARAMYSKFGIPAEKRDDALKRGFLPMYPHGEVSS